LVAQALAGVGRIRDQFAQKHRLLGIDRVHYQLQKFGDIRFEEAAFRSVLLGNGHGGFPGDIFNATCWSEFVLEFFAEMVRAGGAVKPRHQPLAQHGHNAHEESVAYTPRWYPESAAPYRAATSLNRRKVSMCSSRLAMRYIG